MVWCGWWIYLALTTIGDAMNTKLITWVLATLVAACGWPLPLQAADISWTGQPDTYDMHMQPAEIQGFGDWQFGMSPVQVEQQLSAAYPEARIRSTIDPVQQTQMLSVNLSDLTLAPKTSQAAELDSPGPATVTLIFGYRSGTLMTINLNWFALDDVTDAAREKLLAAGSAYVADLLGYYWTPLQTARGHVIGPNNLMLFSGRDNQGHGVEVRVEGVALDVMLPEGGTQPHPVPQGAAQLHISLSAQPDDPDIFHLPDNAF